MLGKKTELSHTNMKPVQGFSKINTELIVPFKHQAECHQKGSDF